MNNFYNGIYVHIDFKSFMFKGRKKETQNSGQDSLSVEEGTAQGGVRREKLEYW